MKTQSYTVLYEADPEGGFVASVPALPGCVSQGDNLEEAERNITEAMELYIETLHDDKLTPPTEHLWQGKIEIAI
ncbi:MAG: type II toxin-antitoxin system HicB family antitoxin [Candidatus Saccharimonadales bacterium]